MFLNHGSGLLPSPEGGGADRRAVTGGRRLDEAAFALGAEPVAVAADRQHMAVVQEPVEDRGRDHGIGEHCAHSATLRFDVISMAPVS